MGVYYMARNLDKREWFDGSDFEGGIKFSSITHPTANFPRGLALILERGSWKGNRVEIISDSGTEQDEYYETEEKWTHTAEAKRLWEENR